MNCIIGPATKTQISECIAALQESTLWNHHFDRREGLCDLFTEGIARNEIVAAMTPRGALLGFAGTKWDGAFYRFPYLRLIAVRRIYRRNGIGGQLIDHFERRGFAAANRLFVLVSDFNNDAARFYADHGYKQVGTVPDLFQAGVSEHILVKYRDSSALN